MYVLEHEGNTIYIPEYVNKIQQKRKKFTPIDVTTDLTGYCYVLSLCTILYIISTSSLDNNPTILIRIPIQTISIGTCRPQVSNKINLPIGTCRPHLSNKKPSQLEPVTRISPTKTLQTRTCHLHLSNEITSNSNLRPTSLQQKPSQLEPVTHISPTKTLPTRTCRPHLSNENPPNSNLSPTSIQQKLS
jgi:hypothetical protein